MNEEDAMMTQEQLEAPELADPVETWLRQIVDHGDRSIEQMAQVMAEDGFPKHQAWIFAAAAWLRYSPVAIPDLFEQESLRKALAHCREHLGAALAEFHAGRPGHGATALRDPASLGNSVILDGRSACVQFVSSHPRVALIGDLLSAEECAALIELARPRLRDSEVTPQNTGQSAVERYTRLSRDTYLVRGMTDILRRIEARVAELVGLPGSHCEDISVIHYPEGGEFLPHVDFLEPDPAGPRVFGSEGDRIATVVVYLNQVEKGGATCFPALGLEVCPQTGSALYFAYQQPDGARDAASLHAGRPVLRGEKWIATFWFHERSCVGADVGG